MYFYTVSFLFAVCRRWFFWRVIYVCKEFFLFAVFSLCESGVPCGPSYKSKTNWYTPEVGVNPGEGGVFYVKRTRDSPSKKPQQKLLRFFSRHWAKQNLTRILNELVPLTGEKKIKRRPKNGILVHLRGSSKFLTSIPVHVIWEILQVEKRFFSLAKYFKYKGPFQMGSRNVTG